MTNRDHQHGAPFDDRNQAEHLPEDLRQVAWRYATLQVPRPTPDETNWLTARLQVSASQNLADPPARLSRRQRRVRPLLETLGAVLVVGVVVSSFLLVLASRLHQPPPPKIVLPLAQPSQKLSCASGSISYPGQHCSPFLPNIR